MLAEKMKAPDFNLPDQNGNLVSLSDFKGKKVILYFYARDLTPGCTRQAERFTELYEALSNYAVIIGISKDSVASHQRFTEKKHLPFILLSDPQLEAIQAYGVWQEKKLYGKVSMGVVRSTFIIDEMGMIEKAMYRVKAATNPDDILMYFQK